MQRIASDEGLQVLKPELGTKPRVYYRNLHYFTHCFVGGTVVTRSGGVEECAAGATVILRKDGSEIARAVTDAFGEWRIDRLAPASVGYQLEVTGTGGRCSMAFDLGIESRYLGVLALA